MVTQLAEFLVVVTLGVALERWVAPVVSKWLTDRMQGITKQRYQPTSIPDPSEEFLIYRLENIETPVMNLVGSPETPFSMNEVDIEYVPKIQHQNPNYPVSLIAARSYLEKEYLKKYDLDKLPQNILPRICGWDQSGETNDNRRGRLTLHFNLTTFDTYLVTNRSLDYEVIPQKGHIGRFVENQTIRQAFVEPPYSLRSSVLANPLAVMVVVISRNNSQTPRNQIIIQKRSNKVASYRGCYQVSAAGYVSLGHLNDDTQAPNPFYTAIHEAREEISDALNLAPSDFNLIGIALSWVDMLPFAYGYIETGHSIDDLIRDFRRDSFEGQLSAIPFEPQEILSRITKEKWTPEGVLALCAVLLAHFPRSEVEAIARKLPSKEAREFFEFT